MARKIVDPGVTPKVNEIEDSHKISQIQLQDTKVYSSREDYVNSLPEGLKFMEIGVAWGYYSNLIAKNKLPEILHMVDWYNQDLKCWSWRKFGACQCKSMKHEQAYSKDTHEIFIKKYFNEYDGAKTIKGNAEDILPTLTEKYDYIYIDISNSRDITKTVLNQASNLIGVNGIIGLNDYVIYDGIIEDMPYGTFQTVNEFLYLNSNWSVDAIALHNLGFYDIYIRKNSD